MRGVRTPGSTAEASPTGTETGFRLEKPFEVLLKFSAGEHARAQPIDASPADGTARDEAVLLERLKRLS